MFDLPGTFGKHASNNPRKASSFNLKGLAMTAKLAETQLWQQNMASLIRSGLFSKADTGEMNGLYTVVGVYVDETFSAPLAKYSDLRRATDAANLVNRLATVRPLDRVELILENEFRGSHTRHGLPLDEAGRPWFFCRPDRPGPHQTQKQDLVSWKSRGRHARISLAIDRQRLDRLLELDSRRRPSCRPPRDPPGHRPSLEPVVFRARPQRHRIPRRADPRSARPPRAAALAHGYLRFHVDSPVTVDVAVPVNSVPFWIADQGFQATNLSLVNCDTSWTVYRKTL